MAILPGVMALGIELDLLRLPIDKGGDPLSLLLLSLVLCALSLVLEKQLAVWSFPALGIGLAYLMFVMLSVLDGLSVSGLQGVLFVVFYGILPIGTGLLLARRTGVLAGLVFIGTAYVYWDTIGDPEYALLIYTDDTALVTLISVFPQIFFLIIAPILVLRLPSTVARIVAYVATLSVALVGAAAIGASIRPEPSFVYTIGVDFALILLPLVSALTLYAWVGKTASALNQVSQT